MRLKIASPVYYKSIHGLDYDIAYMCRDINEYVENIEYGSSEIIISIQPIIVPLEILQFGFWRESISVQLKGRYIEVDKHINYYKYVRGDFEERKKLMLGNILRSVKSVKGKCNVDYERFEKDILDMFNYEKNDIKPYMKNEKIEIVNEKEAYLTKIYMISPVYYSDKNDIGNEAEEIAKKLSSYMVDKSYSKEVERIFVFPMSAPVEIIEKDLCFESVQYAKDTKYIVLQKRINYKKYLNANLEEKQKYLVANLLKGIEEISKEAKINYEDFEKDALMCLDYTKEEIGLFYE